VKQRDLDPNHASAILQIFKDTFSAIYKWAMANLHFVMNFLQIHVLHTLFILLESILPCMQKEDERAVKLVEEKTKLQIAKEAAERNVAKSKSEVDDMDDDEEEDVEEEEEEVEEIEPQEEIQKNDFEQCYIFALSWAFGGYLEDSERLKLESFKRNHSKLKLPALAGGDSIFDYNVNPATGKWFHWNEAIANYVPPDITPQNYGGLLIPNIGSIRTEFLTNCAASLGQNVLLIGEQGLAKTTLVYSYLRKKSPESHVIANSNFSSSTTPQIFQKNIES